MLRQFRTTFQITRNGVPIQETHLLGIIQTGIELDHLPGCIPVYYEVAACNAANYRYFHDWQELNPDQQATLIAHYFSTIWINNNKDDAEYRYNVNKQRTEDFKAQLHGGRR